MGKKLILITAFLPLILLMGCWSKTELNDLAIVLAMAIDKSEEGYLISVQIINPSEIAAQTQTSETSVTTYSASGETVFEATRKLTQQVPGDIYFAHLRVVIFGEELAKEGIRKPLDFLSRNHEMRTDFYILVSKDGPAKPLLKILTSLERIPANSMYDSLQMSEKRWAPTKGMTLDQLISDLIKKGKHPILTGIYIEGDADIGNSLKNVEEIEPPAMIILDHLAAFYNDQLVGWLNQDESKGYNYILGDVKDTIGTIPCSEGDNENISLEVMRENTNLKGTVKNGEPEINIHLKIEANVGDVECTIDILNPKVIKELEKKAAKEVEDRIEKAIKKAQSELKSDIFGFGSAIHRSDPKAWKLLKDEWDARFPDLSVTSKVDFKIRHLGTITESFQDVNEEGNKEDD